VSLFYQITRFYTAWTRCGLMPFDNRVSQTLTRADIHIIDQFKANSPRSLSAIKSTNERILADGDAFFLNNGHWNSGPSAWNDPEAAFKQQEFWVIYETCQNNLPPKMAQVFMLRELLGLETEEVCREAGISDANYWVIMHRARLRLRECLEIHWFNSSKVKKEHRHA